jgi:prolyl-tRNA editing enzyme YbaK/EbsC (Cys-tRNA(Pro) deacylase)
MPVYAEASIFDLPLVYLNGGARGFLVCINPLDLQKLLDIELVEVGIPG